jgi:ribosome-associated protein
MVRITPEITLADAEIHERFVPSAGSQSRKQARGGTGVELRLDILRASLPDDVKARLLALGGHRVTAQGELVVVSRADRSLERNRAAARDRMVSIIRAAARAPKERLPISPPRTLRPSRATGRAHAALHRAVAGKVL